MAENPDKLCAERKKLKQLKKKKKYPKNIELFVVR